MIRPSKRRPVGFIVRPGRSVGEFILGTWHFPVRRLNSSDLTFDFTGSKISEGFNYIRKNADIFTSVEFKYNEIVRVSYCRLGFFFSTLPLAHESRIVYCGKC
jgi:hypothetical protein